MEANQNITINPFGAINQTHALKVLGLITLKMVEANGEIRMESFV